MKKSLLTLVFVICAVGFAYDAWRWFRQGDHTLLDLVWHYWWAILFIVAFGVERLIRRSRSA